MNVDLVVFINGNCKAIQHICNNRESEDHYYSCQIEILTLVFHLVENLSHMIRLRKI